MYVKPFRIPISLSFVSFIGVRDGISDKCDIWIDAHPTLKSDAKKQYQTIATTVSVDSFKPLQA